MQVQSGTAVTNDMASAIQRTVADGSCIMTYAAFTDVNCNILS